MSQIVLHAAMVIISIGLYLGTMVMNELAFVGLEEFPGVNWVFLPAGIRLLCTLLFGIWGAAGIWLASLFITTQYLFPDQLINALALSAISALAPLLVYLSARHYFGLAETLINLSPRRLLICCVTFGVVSACLHHVWFFFSATSQVSPTSLIAMITGDIVGAVIVLYALKMALALLPRSRLPAGQ